MAWHIEHGPRDHVSLLQQPAPATDPGRQMEKLRPRTRMSHIQGHQAALLASPSPPPGPASSGSSPRQPPCCWPAPVLLPAVYSPRGSQRDPAPRRVPQSLGSSLPHSGRARRQAPVLMKTFRPCKLCGPRAVSLLSPRSAPLQLLLLGVCFLEHSSRGSRQHSRRQKSPSGEAFSGALATISTCYLPLPSPPHFLSLPLVLTTVSQTVHFTYCVYSRPLPGGQGFVLGSDAPEASLGSRTGSGQAVRRALKSLDLGMPGWLSG
ncbi:uncharacterized protein LOC119865650 isoform X5 [Canis lupus familiaris]|uniref:uncharacterized protein LOC119865650 isoform X5 n=1 Tax=Canis lupus familiaris TaxID=9615 RepID=UPI0018F6F47C|nr:uncharacterized protein LOC119865650 isoform X5 [Canis lupus familiaris]